MISTLSRADAAVRFRDTDKGQQQRDVLRRLEQQSGRKRSAIVAELDAEINVGHDQYRRYLRGDTPLRWDQIDVFARAFGATKAELSRALGLLDDEPIPALLSRTVAALGACSDDETARAVERELRKRTPSERSELLADLREGSAEHLHS